MHSLLHSNFPASYSLLRGGWCWCHPTYPSLNIFPLSHKLLQGEWHEVFLQDGATAAARCDRAAVPATDLGWDYCRTPRTAQGPALLYHSPVYSTAVLRDSQRKTTICSSRLSPKVLWSQKKDIIDYSCLWIKPKHRKQNWYLSKPRRLVFFPAFDWSFTCNSLLPSPAQGLAREPQRKQLIRNCVWTKRINFMFSTHPCFV